MSGQVIVFIIATSVLLSPFVIGMIVATIWYLTAGCDGPQKYEKRPPKKELYKRIKQLEKEKRDYELGLNSNNNTR